MTDDRSEELAALHTFDLLEGDDRSRFAAELDRDPELRALVRDFRAAGSALAYTATTAVPPPTLRTRVLDSIQAGPARSAPRQPGPLIFRTFAPWALAASLALCASWLALLYLSTQAESELLRNQVDLAGVSLQATRQQLEAERIIARQQVTDLERQKSAADTQLAAVRTQAAEREQQIARLTRDLKSQVDLANLKVTALASLLNNSPKALAVAVWDSARQEGLLKVEKLPALQPSQDYQLWVVDPQYPNPVDGGVFTVDPTTGDARLVFRAKQPVGSVNAFAVTLERKGGVPKAEGPFVLLGK